MKREITYTYWPTSEDKQNWDDLTRVQAVERFGEPTIVAMETILTTQPVTPLKTVNLGDVECVGGGGIMAAKKAQISGVGYVLGHGVLYNPSSVRIDGTYAFVGVVNEDHEWKNIQPYAKGVGWLETLGKGRLVFIPDKQEDVKG